LNRKKIAIGFTAVRLGSVMTFKDGGLRILRSLSSLCPVLLSEGADYAIPGYYKRNRHFQCCIETKLLMI